MFLHNRLGREQLLARLEAETFPRKTLSFYRYVPISDPHAFRDDLYAPWDAMGCLGRIYVAREGINAQMSIPEPRTGDFLAHLESISQLADMPLKWALEDSSRSFLKLKIKVRHKIVADGLPDDAFDVTNVGRHLQPLEFHHLLDSEDVLVVDMRNNYESEVGRFENAICPDAVSFREEVEMVAEQLADQKDRKVLLYCTGGVRCEKASAWLRHHGFSDVNQLHGGIIAYAAEIKQQGLQSKFVGKNFVFDERLGERITPDVIARCHSCDASCDDHLNCAYDPCHRLFIQCAACRVSLQQCCSDECLDNLRHGRSIPPTIPNRRMLHKKQES
jgi:UPF0176 protein